MNQLGRSGGSRRRDITWCYLLGFISAGKTPTDRLLSLSQKKVKWKKTHRFFCAGESSGVARDEHSADRTVKGEQVCEF